MNTIMIATMTIQDEAWMAAYFQTVPTLLAEHGGHQIAAARDIRIVEGQGVPPDRVAIFAFPAMDAIDRFLADPRYHPFRDARMASTESDIMVFENVVTSGFT